MKTILEALKNKIDLTNKYIFWLIIGTTVVLLTTINNYYFYDYMNVLSKRDSAKLGKQLKLTVKHCHKNKFSDNVCENLIVTTTKFWAKKTIYNKSLQVITLDGTTNVIRDGLKYTSAIGSEIKINTRLLLDLNDKGFASKHDDSVHLNQLFPTVYRSVTFSLEDIYKSLTKKLIASKNGVVIEINDKYVIIQYKNQHIQKFRYFKHDLINVKKGATIEKDQLIVSGNIHSAIDTFIHFIPRSRPFLGYLLIVFILLTISKKREEAYKKSILNMAKEKKKAQEKFEETIRKINIESAEKLDTFKKIEEEENQVCQGFTKFDNILNPPVNAINIRDLLDSNLSFVGTAFRQVLEKIIFKVYDEKISNSDPKRTLASAIYNLEKEEIINKRLSQTLHAVRIYGNDFTHYSDKTTTKTEALVAAMNLLSIMEEIESIYLDIKDHTKKQSGLRIVKRAKNV